MRTLPASASTQSAHVPVPMPNALTTVACAAAMKPLWARNPSSQSVHSCVPHTTCVLSFSSSDPHSQHTRIAG